MMEKGFTEVTAASKTAYTAVAGDQIGVDTVANIVTITLLHHHKVMKLVLWMYQQLEDLVQTK